MSLLLFVFLNLFANHDAYVDRVAVSVSEQDAKIFLDGVLIGNGTAKVVVPKGSCANLKVTKVGFLTVEKNYCNKKGFADPPSKDFIKMEVDDAYSATFKSDVANVDISIRANQTPDAWKTLNQIILTYFDVIELADKETSYLRTAWVAQSFKSGVVRTRLITKGDPSGYKVKLVSEISGQPGASVKSDEAFREWDRVLRKYEGLVNELQSRIK